MSETDVYDDVEDLSELDAQETLAYEGEYDEFTTQFLSQLEADKTWALSFYAGRNQEFERMERWYFKEHYAADAEIPVDGNVMEEAIDEVEAEHLTILPIPTNMINTVHGIFFDEDPYIQCLSTTGRKSAEAATKTERFCHGTYWINRQVSGEDPWDASGNDFLIDGWGCIYTYWDTERAKLARKKADAGKAKDSLDFYTYPLVVRRIHPRDIYPLPWGVRERWRGIMWMVNRTVREIEEEWNCTLEPRVRLDTDGAPLTDSEFNPIYEELTNETFVEYVDYWVWRREDDGDWMLYHAVVANGQCIKLPTKMPEYEMLPYEIFFCRQTPSDSGSRMGLSFLYPVIEPVQEMEYLANRQSRMVEQYADPILLIVDPSGSSADEDIEKGPGTTITVNPGGDAHYVTWNGSPPDFSQLMRMWREIAQDAFPPVMTGLAGGTSGLDTIALQQGGKLQTNKPRRNLELAMQRVNTKIIRLLQRFSWDDAVSVMGQRSEGDESTPFSINVRGRDTRGFENTVVQIRGRFPQEELRNVVVASQATGAGLMSRRRAAGKYLYVQDPEAEFKSWFEEQIIVNPQWQQFFFQMYTALPARSPVTEALTAPEEEPQDDMAVDLAGADLASEMANTPEGVQAGVQRTPIESNLFSKLAGGAPRVY